MGNTTTAEYGYEEKPRKSKIKTLKFEKDKRSGEVFVYVNSKKLSLDELSLEEFAILKEEAVYKMKEITPKDRNGNLVQRLLVPVMIGWGTGLTITNVMNFQPDVSSILKLLVVGGITIGFFVKYIKDTIRMAKASKLYYDCKELVNIFENINGAKQFITEFTKQIFGEDIEITGFRKITREEFESHLKDSSNDNCEENGDKDDENE